jgi:hypothetical protein
MVRKLAIGCGGLLGIVVLLAIVGALIGGGNDTQPSSQAEKQEQTAGVEEVASEQPAQSDPYPNFGEGAQRVGTDIQPGTYRTREGKPGCYYERLSGFSNQMDDVLANGNADGPVVIEILATDAGFDSHRCGTWTQDLSQITQSKTSFGEGAFIVGTDIEPGTYRSSGQSGCYYQRLSGFSGGMDSVIANENADGPAVVAIAPTDVGFESHRCGTWSKVN